jgi:hypothetical protein
VKEFFRLYGSIASADPDISAINILSAVAKGMRDSGRSQTTRIHNRYERIAESADSTRKGIITAQAVVNGSISSGEESKPIGPSPASQEAEAPRSLASFISQRGGTSTPRRAVYDVRQRRIPRSLPKMRICLTKLRDSIWKKPPKTLDEMLSEAIQSFRTSYGSVEKALILPSFNADTEDGGCMSVMQYLNDVSCHEASDYMWKMSRSNDLYVHRKRHRSGDKLPCTTAVYVRAFRVIEGLPLKITNVINDREDCQMWFGVVRDDKLVELTVEEYEAQLEEFEEFVAA